MNIKENWGILRRVIGVAVLATTLAACGGQTSGDSTSSASAATDNTAAVVSLSSALYAATVNRNLVVTINRTGTSTGAATVGYTTVNGTATAGADYVATSGTVSWGDGEMGAKVVTVPVLNGASGKDFGFALTSVQGGANVGSPAAATIGVTNAATALDSSSSGGSPSSSSSSGATSGSGSSSSGVTAGNPPSGSSSSGGTSTSGAYNPNFPRLGTYYIGTQSFGGGTGGYNLNWVNYLAAFNINVLGVNAGQGSNMYGGSYSKAIAEVKALSPVGTKNIQFYNSQFYYPGTFPSGQVAQVNAMDAFPNWRAWTNAVAKSGPVSGGGGSGLGNTNQTIGALPSGSSQLQNSTYSNYTWEVYFAQQLYKFFFAGTGGASSADLASNLDGIYHDNYLTVPAVAYDYDFSGSPTNPGDANFDQSHRDGLASGTKWLLANTTGGAPNGSLYLMGNLNTWVPNYGYDPPTGMTGNLHGGVWETAFGDSYSPNTTMGFGSATSGGFGAYVSIMADLQSPQMLLIEQDNLTSNGTDGIVSGAANYAAMRYGLTFTLLLNGYYQAKNEDAALPTNIWFDEWSVDPSSGVACGWNGSISSVSSCLGYMGQPTSTWGQVSGSGGYQVINGLYVRMFYNATTKTTWVAICAPSGKGGGGGPFTISASALHAGSAGFRMITGAQDPNINNGSTVSSITIPTGYDGRIVQLL
jgi:Calx-beta domain